MKNSSFENNLKTIAQGFEVDVNQQQFNRVMELRAQQNKRKKLFWWFASTAAVLFSTLFFIPTNQFNATPSKKIIKGAYKNEKEQSDVLILAHKSENNVRKAPALNQAGSKEKNNKQAYQRVNTNGLASSIIKKNSKATKRLSENQPIPQNNNAKLVSAKTDRNKVIISITNKPELINAHLTPPGLTPEPQLTALPFENKIFDQQGNANTLKLLKGVYVHATYFPFLSAKNTTSLMPDKKASMVGLSEDANFASAVNIGVLINVNNNIHLMAGVGVHNLRFDKIRAVSITVDTMPESLTNSATKLNFEHVADFSFTWLDVPFALRYSSHNKNRTNWYIQAGVNYRYLVQHKSYVFHVDSNSLETHELRTNYAENRVNKHMLSIVAEPGVMYNVNRNIALNIGIPFQQDIVALYNKEYADRNTFKLLGIKAGMQFNF